jgi:hypothetical protein
LLRSVYEFKLLPNYHGTPTDDHPGALRNRVAFERKIEKRPLLMRTPGLLAAALIAKSQAPSRQLELHTIVQLAGAPLTFNKGSDHSSTGVRRLGNSSAPSLSAKIEPQRRKAAFRPASFSPFNSRFSERLRGFSRITPVLHSASPDSKGTNQGSNASRAALIGLRLRPDTLAPFASHGHGLQMFTPKPSLNEFPKQQSSKAFTVRSNMPSKNESRPIQIDFSPTVVLNNINDQDDFERRVVQAIGRHGHELARLVFRELQTKQRAAI